MVGMLSHNRYFHLEATSILSGHRNNELYRFLAFLHLLFIQYPCVVFHAQATATCPPGAPLDGASLSFVFHIGYFDHRKKPPTMTVAKPTTIKVIPPQNSIGTIQSPQSLKPPPQEYISDRNQIAKPMIMMIVPNWQTFTVVMISVIFTPLSNDHLANGPICFLIYIYQ